MGLRKERTLTLLTQAFFELMHEKPFAEMTVGELCERAMVRRATFYRHFSDKQDFLVYVVRRRRSEILGERPEVEGEQATEDLESITARLTAKLVYLCGTHRDLLARNALDPGFAEVENAIVSEISSQVATLLLEREFASERTPANERRIEVKARYYASGLVGGVRWWLTECPDMPEAEFIAALNTLGIATIHAHKA